MSSIKAPPEGLQGPGTLGERGVGCEPIVITLKLCLNVSLQEGEFRVCCFLGFERPARIARNLSPQEQQSSASRGRSLPYASRALPKNRQRGTSRG